MEVMMDPLTILEESLERQWDSPGKRALKAMCYKGDFLKSVLKWQLVL